jgi:hypothetical protein
VEIESVIYGPVSIGSVTGFPMRNVVLRPWQRAFFTFTYVASGPCRPHFFNAYGLKIVPPGTKRRLVLFRGRFDLCAPSVGGKPGVYPVRRRLAL